MRAARRSRPQADRDEAARRIAAVALSAPAIAAAGCLALYASMPDEPGTGPLRASLRTQGTRLLLPVVPTPALPGTSAPGTSAPGTSAAHAHPGGAEHTLYWGVDDGGELVAGAGLGMPEPGGQLLGPAALAEAEVVLVPALAVDEHGHRLGKGRGYYDAALRHAAPTALIVAVLFDDEVLPTPIPHEEHDVPVGGVLTPRLIRFF